MIPSLRARLLFPALLGATLLLAPLPARAWGPHSEITQAAVDTLSPADPLRQELGAETARLRDYCWMADWRRSLHREADNWFYVDDYLLFPAMTTHRDHLCPEVKQTYEPYFRRALQALRTESPRNAARWIGSIMHFTEDTGSPPHAAEIRGDVHSKMENWVDARAIAIAGYTPQLLGETDDEAVAGFLRRMDGLIEFSKQRAERAKPLVLAGDRPATEPIVLESALEVSRVVADLLHTLGTLAARPESSAGGGLEGTIVSTAPPGLEKLPAKIVLSGTLFSTLAEPSGEFAFHRLPPGDYELAAFRNGSEPVRQEVHVTAGQLTTALAKLEPAGSGNLLRNPDFHLRWLAAAQPDAWYPARKRYEEPHWESDLIPLQSGQTYRVRALWQEAAEGQVVIHLLPQQLFEKPATDLPPLMPGATESSFQAGADNPYAQIFIYSKDPGAALQSISLTAAP